MNRLYSRCFPPLTSRSYLSESGGIKDERAGQHPCCLASPVDEFLLGEAANGPKEATRLLFRRYQRVVWRIGRHHFCRKTAVIRRGAIARKLLSENFAKRDSSACLRIGVWIYRRPILLGIQPQAAPIRRHCSKLSRFANSRRSDSPLNPQDWRRRASDGQ